MQALLRNSSFQYVSNLMCHIFDALGYRRSITTLSGRMTERKRVAVIRRQSSSTVAVRLSSLANPSFALLRLYLPAQSKEELGRRYPFSAEQPRAPQVHVGPRPQCPMT